MKLKFSLLIIVTILLIPFALAWAQLSGLSADAVQLSISPQNPGPNQSVQASLTSYSTDINRADITWSINGSQVSSGKGLRTFNFTTGELGTKTALEVLIVSEEGYPILKDLTFSPASVDLLIEAQSYTPPFYRGKAYLPYQGQARVIAVPSFADDTGKQIPSSNLVFNWMEGNKNIINSSGLGKNILMYKSGLPIRTGVISVEVSSFDRKYVAEGRINAEPTESKVVLYEDDPEYGVLYNKAISNSLNLNQVEVSIFAIPFYFNISNPNDYNLKYEWNLNGAIINASGNSIVLKKPDSSSGQANLVLQLSNTVDIFQFSKALLTVNFGTAAKNIFNPFSQ